MREVVNRLISTPTPAREIAQVVACSHGPDASAFERYAGMALEDAGAKELPRFSPQRTVQLVPPAEGHLVRLVCAGELDENERALLGNVEGALNRLLGIADAIEDSADLGEREGARPRIGMSPLGTGFLPTGAPYRSALVRLPEIGLSQTPTPAYFNEVDWRVLDHIAANAHAVFQNSLLPNLHQSFMGAHAPDGSDWDVRTRLASILGGLELPLRSECRFDCDVEDAAAFVRFTVPSASSFPQRIADGHGAIADVGTRLEAAQMTYCIRLACLLAAACFGSGRRIEHADVTAVQESRSGSATVFRHRFERHDYVHGALCAIDSGELASANLRFAPEIAAEIAGVDLEKRVLTPASVILRAEPEESPQRGVLGIPRSARNDGLRRISLDSRPSGQTAKPERGNLPETPRIAPHLDERELPPDMQRLFHARRICDIDTVHYHGGRGGSVHEALIDSRDSAVAAIARLEGVVEALEASADAPGDDADARPLFCANPLSRAVVSLLDDELTVASQAESYLQEEGADDARADELPRYFRAPSALFHAHMGLSDLYERLGDLRGAEAQADRCIMLAPTTASAYFRKADVLAQQSRFHEAANVLLSGLRTAVDRADCALLYYHLALILWNIGRENAAAAVHVYTASLDGEFAEKAAKAVEGLRKRADKSVIVYASPLAAANEMKRARIPLAPSNEARALVLRAAVGLSCANAPLAAAPYATEIARYFRDDRIIVDTARSLIEGTG